MDHLKYFAAASTPSIAKSSLRLSKSLSFRRTVSLKMHLSLLKLLRRIFAELCDFLFYWNIIWSLSLYLSVRLFLRRSLPHTLIWLLAFIFQENLPPYALLRLQLESLLSLWNWTLQKINAVVWRSRQRISKLHCHRGLSLRKIWSASTVARKLIIEYKFVLVWIESQSQTRLWLVIWTPIWRGLHPLIRFHSILNLVEILRSVIFVGVCHI